MSKDTDQDIDIEDAHENYSREDEEERKTEEEAEEEKTLDSLLVDYWEEFLRSYKVRRKHAVTAEEQVVYKYFDKILQMQAEKLATLEVNFEDIVKGIEFTEDEKKKKHYETIKRSLSADIDRFEKVLREAVSNILKEHAPDYYPEIDKVLNVGITNYEITKELPDLDSLDVSNTRRVEGIVIQYDTEKQIHVLESCWRCTQGHEFFVHGARKPKKCYYECDGVVASELVEKRKIVDFMYIRIQQRPETMREGRVDPYEMDVFFEGNEKVNKVKNVIQPGLYIAVNGLITLTETNKGSPDFVGLEMQGSAIEVLSESHIIGEDTRLDNYVKREIPAEYIPAHFEKLCRSIAPHLEGLELLKQAILLQAIGTEPKIKSIDGSRVRGDSNILIVASTGKGKTELLIFASRLRPRSEYLVGTGSTPVGLTAGVQSVEVIRGGLKLNSKRVYFGAYSRCNNGLLCLDEIEKGKDYYDAINSPMDDWQQIPLSKHGVNKTLNARCASLHAANPTTNRGIYDPSLPFFEQIDLPTYLLSKYDLIFAIKDDNSDAARHKLWQQIEASYDTAVTEKESERRAKLKDTALEDIDVKGDHYSEGYLRREVIYLREKYSPKIKQGSIAWNLMKSFWNRYNKKNLIIFDDEDKLTNPSKLNMPATDVRKINTLIRLSEASARAHRRNDVLQDDMDIAINLVKTCVASLIPQKDDEAKAIFSAALINKGLKQNAIRDAERKHKQDIDDRRQHFMKFLNTVGNMTFSNCDKCGGKGRVRANKNEYGQTEPAECGVCQGTRGQYARFSISSLKAWFADIKIMPAQYVTEFLQLTLTAKIIKPTSGGDFKVDADLKDIKYIRLIASELFGIVKEEQDERDLEAAEQAKRDIESINSQTFSRVSDLPKKSGDFAE